MPSCTASLPTKIHPASFYSLRLPWAMGLVLFLLFAIGAARAGAQQTISTYAGGGPNNLPATSANINTAEALAQDAAGNVYIGDQANNRIFKVDAHGMITVVAGNGLPGFSGDGGPATEASLYVNQIAVDAHGNLFFTGYSPLGDARVREVYAATGIIQTVAGGGNSAPGPGVLATAAQLDWLGFIAVDSNGNLYFRDSNDFAGLPQLLTVSSTTQFITVMYNGEVGAMHIDSANNLYFLDNGGGTLDKVALPNGQLVQVRQVNAYDFAFDQAGDLFLTDQNPGASVVELPVAGGAPVGMAGGGNLAPAAGFGGPATAVSLPATGGLVIQSDGTLVVGYMAATNENPHYVFRLPTDGTIEAFAGTGNATYAGDGYCAACAALGNTLPQPAIDPAGDVYFADQQNNRVREVVASTGNIVTVAGNGISGFSGDNGPATAAELAQIGGVALDAAGDLFIADAGNQRVREVAAATGIIQTVAGGGANAGEGVPALQAQLAGPNAVTVDAAGDLFILDASQRVREVGAKGNIATVAGSGTGGDGGLATAAQIVAASGIALDSAGNLYIADGGYGEVRKVAVQTGIITAVAGGNGNQCASGGGNGYDGGSALAACIAPSGVTVDPSGDIFLSDANGWVGEVGASTGALTAVAGTGVAGSSGDGGLATSAQLYAPSGVALDASGDLFITDNTSGRIREVANAEGQPSVNLSQQAITFGNQPQNSTSAATAVTVGNAGPGPLHFSSLALSGANAADFALASSTTCALATVMANGASCTLAITFTPSTTANENAVLTLSDNADPGFQTVALSGSGTVPAAVAAFSPASLVFPSQATASTSAAQAVTLTNTGSAPLTIAGIAVSGDFAQTNTCGASLAAGANCTIAVTFTPTATGARTGTLTVTDNAAGSPQTAALTGTGADLTIAPPSGSSTSSTVAPGQSATYSLNFTPVSGLTGTFTLTCTGAPAGAACTPSPASLTLSGSTPLPVTVTVSTTAASLLPPLPVRPTPGRPVLLWLLAALALLLALAMRIASGKPRKFLIGASAFALLSLMVACGGGGGSSTTPATPSATPAGTYPLTVTATSGAVSRTATLTLIVN